MENAQIEKMKSIIVDKINCKPEDVVPTATFEELGLDSLDAIELVMAFEEEFGVEIPDEEADKIKTVGDAISSIDSKLNA